MLVRIWLSLMVLAAVNAQTQAGTEWLSWGGDSGGSKHSPLTKIDRKNVGRLSVAWVFDAKDVSDGTTYPTRSAFEATPLMAGGLLYVSTPFSRVLAVDPDTGREVWAFDPAIDRTARMNLFVSRGVAYDGARGRIYFGDLEARLWALDAKTGRPVPAFGNDGKIDLRDGMMGGAEGAQYRVTSPPAVCGDAVVTGALVSDSQPAGPSGDIRAFHAGDGRLLWRFRTVPGQKEPGGDTWAGESATRRGGANAWSVMSVDEKARTVFAPLTSPSYDFYGGDRKGANLYGNSLVALDCTTGKLKWHYQTVHHDIWDYDLPAQPVLTTVRRNG